MVKNACGQYGLWTLNMIVSQEGTDTINWFFACWYKFMQIKMWLKIFGTGMVKSGCGQSGDGTLKLTVSEEWRNRIIDFLHDDRDSEKLKADQNFWVSIVKNQCDKSDHGTLKLTVSQNEQME